MLNVTLDNERSIYSTREEWLSYILLANELICNDYEIVVVTDHNSVDGIKKLELVLQRKLLGWKDNHADMRNWSLLEYVAYLYEHFGVPPVVDKGLAKKKPRLKKLKDELKSFDGRHPKTRLTEVEIKERSALVSSIVKEQAAGVCQLCNKPAPFFNKNGEAYLECHHIVWLARGGVDEIYNAVALCPNCHRKMHILDIPEDIEYLKNVAKADK